MNKRKPAECGTVAGYLRHHYNGEEYCEPCRAAHSAKQKQLRAARGEKVSDKRRRAVAACGTPSGYAKHLRDKTPACQACKKAHQEKSKESLERTDPTGEKRRAYARHYYSAAGRKERAEKRAKEHQRKANQIILELIPQLEALNDK